MSHICMLIVSPGLLYVGIKAAARGHPTGFHEKSVGCLAVRSTSRSRQMRVMHVASFSSRSSKCNITPKKPWCPCCSVEADLVLQQHRRQRCIAAPIVANEYSVAAPSCLIRPTSPVSAASHHTQHRLPSTGHKAAQRHE